MTPAVLHAQTEPGSLVADGVGVHFSGLKAIDAVDLALDRGEILGLIGPNGAGKTTMVNVLSGFQRPTHGRVVLDGRDVTRSGPRRIATAGVARTFQAVRPFAEMTVFENVEVAAVASGGSRRGARAVTRELLRRFGLDRMASLSARSLTHGQERRMGMARALAGRPRFLLLDEPAAGLNESESDELVDVLRDVRGAFEVGMLVIEHDMRVIMSLCERIQVLDYGRTIAIGTPAEVRADSAVVTAYLGTGRGADAERA